jgi:5'-nucleotidase
VGSEVQILSSRPSFLWDVGLAEILLTNDDGIYSEGINVLAEALSLVGQVTVIAPDRERSASSQSLTLHRPIRYEEIGPRRYSVEGTPTDCIIIALHHILPALPDLVVSGINKGANLGHDIGYSGTVSAAMEAANYDISSFAISLASQNEFKFNEAGQFAVALAEKILSDPLPPGMILNVNIPNREIKGVRITRQGHRNVRNLIVENIDPRGRKYFWLDQELEPEGHQGSPDSDYMAISEGYISVTPLRIDRTGIDMVDKIEGWPETLFKEKIDLTR